MGFLENRLVRLFSRPYLDHFKLYGIGGISNVKIAEKEAQPYENECSDGLDEVGHDIISERLFSSVERGVCTISLYFFVVKRVHS